jgi:site-specific recombinase XerD
MATNKRKPKHHITYTKGSGYKIKLKGKLNSNGKISLFLEQYNGYSSTNEGKIKVSRSIETLNIYIHENPRTPDERRENDENLRLANHIRNKRETDLQHKGAGLVAPFRKKSNFFDYCTGYEQGYKKADIKMIRSAIKEFKSYTRQSYLKPSQIDPAMVKGFRDYLLEKFNGATPHSYFARFKKILSAATEAGLFIKSPGDKITCPEPDEITKHILMPEEIIRLAETDCGNPITKRAFLFCLNTGLRFNDVSDLRYEHIVDNQIRKKQNKTGKMVTIDLNPTAVKLIGPIGKPEDFIFILPSFTACLSTIRNWAARAGINKKITWHSARHSFGTILTMNNTHIVTVKNLMGHSKLEHTQKYTHVIDQLRAQAVNTLPDLNV